jgi:hypothetical protein
VGFAVGATVGAAVGASVGSAVGAAVGAIVGVGVDPHSWRSTGDISDAACVKWACSCGYPAGHSHV